jgi:multidrug efflux pump subunit AcrA (membrane-fusion protein)
MRSAPLVSLALALVTACGEGGAPAAPPSPTVTPAATAGARAPSAPAGPTAAPSMPAPAAAAPPATPTPRALVAPCELVLDADAAAALTTPLPARIERIHVRPGDQVEAGAALVTLIAPEAAIAVAQARGAADQLAALEIRRRALADLVAASLARAADLAELDARLAALRGERGVALAVVRAANLSEGDAAARGRVVLRAPAAGLVTAVTAVAGEGRAPGDPALVRLQLGGARRVVVRWASAPRGPRATLHPGLGEPRALTVTASAPTDDGAIAVWYDVAGPPVPAGRCGQVTHEDAP